MRKRTGLWPKVEPSGLQRLALRCSVSSHTSQPTGHASHSVALRCSVLPHTAGHSTCLQLRTRWPAVVLSIRTHTAVAPSRPGLRYAQSPPRRVVDGLLFCPSAHSEPLYVSTASHSVARRCSVCPHTPGRSTCLRCGLQAATLFCHSAHSEQTAAGRKSQSLRD